MSETKQNSEHSGAPLRCFEKTRRRHPNVLHSLTTKSVSDQQTDENSNGKTPSRYSEKTQWGHPTVQHSVTAKISECSSEV